MGAPRWPPNPPSLVAPRRSRGAPRSQSQVMGPRDGPQTPLRSSRPGGAVARLDHSRDGAPRWPNPANVRIAPAKPWRSSITLLSLSAQHRAQQDMRGDVDEQRKEDEHAGEIERR